jgi:peptide/nickel transport system ATP-binding protein
LPKELLHVSNLKTHFHTPKGTIKAVDGVSFAIDEASTLGLTGESGSGKTTVAFSILRLIQCLSEVSSSPLRRVVSRGAIVDGEVLLKGRDLLKLSEDDLRRVRGKEISIIFQNPIPSLHPMEIIGYQIGEALEAHEQVRREAIRKVVLEYLGKVDLKDPKYRYYNIPNMFSGGEGQRIMIAMALICGPSLLIADEPTKSLDVTVQRQVLQLLKEMKRKFNVSMLLITHDIAIIAELSDHVAIMYAGKLVEYGDVISIYKEPKHPYTRGLLAATPRITGAKKKLRGLKGEPPNPLAPIPGCKFHPRCKHVRYNCHREEPSPIEIQPGHWVACLRVHDLPDAESLT